MYYITFHFCPERMFLQTIVALKLSTSIYGYIQIHLLLLLAQIHLFSAASDCLFICFNRAAAIAERSKSLCCVSQETFQLVMIYSFSEHKINCVFFGCLSCLDRARVVGGLPDVVAIQEGKVTESCYITQLIDKLYCNN